MADQRTMYSYLTSDDTPRIYVDSREASNKNGKKIVNLIEELGAKTAVTKLDYGDYLLGADTVVERKTVFDLVNTLTQRFLFDQIFEMKAAYPKSLVVIEGYMGLLRKFRRIRPESLSGVLFALAQANIPIVPTIDYKDTATFLVTSSKQLLKNKKLLPVIRHKNKTENIPEQQLFAVTGLPHIGPTLGESLLRQFKTVRAVFMSSKKELVEIKGIGSQIAEDITKLLDAPYEQTI